MSRKIPDDDEDVIARLTVLLSPQGFALLEALAEQLRKNPPTDDDLKHGGANAAIDDWCEVNGGGIVTPDQLEEMRRRGH